MMHGMWHLHFVFSLTYVNVVKVIRYFMICFVINEIILFYGNFGHYGQTIVYDIIVFV